MEVDIANWKDLDFSIVNEDWSRYFAQDGTTLKVRIVVKKILRTAETGPLGYPNFTIESMNAVSALVPDINKRRPSSESWDPKKDVGQEIKFDPIDEKWQEYHTHDGFKITIKPVVTKVFRYNKYNNFGEPIYNLIIQNLLNIDKLELPK